MPRYWWVNHKQTFEEEVGDGFLWSPQQQADGKRSQFYQNMRKVRVGEPVISFAGGQIRAIGRVAGLATASYQPFSRPPGTGWRSVGWYVPVVWQLLKAPLRPKDFIDELRPLLPAKYSPLQRDTGDGLQGAYLAEVSSGLLDWTLGKIADPSLSAWLLERLIPVDRTEELDASLPNLDDDDTLDQTTRDQLGKARVGQGAFRGAVIAQEPRCRVTGLDRPDLLIASHVKPWRVCETASERLSGDNGLLLAPNIDKLFDKGLITFSDSGEVLCSSLLSYQDALKLGLDFNETITTGPLRPAQQPFMDFHRKHVFLIEE